MTPRLCLVLALALIAGPAFAKTSAKINGVEFTDATVSVQHREYRGEKTNACNLSISLARKGFLVNPQITNSKGAKAACRDVPLAAVAAFVSTSKPALAALLKGLSAKVWSAEEPQDLKKNSIYCTLFADKIVPASALDAACYKAMLAGDFTR